METDFENSFTADVRRNIVAYAYAYAAYLS